MLFHVDHSQVDRGQRETFESFDGGARHGIENLVLKHGTGKLEVVHVKQPVTGFLATPIQRRAKRIAGPVPLAVAAAAAGGFNRHVVDVPAGIGDRTVAGPETKANGKGGIPGDVVGDGVRNLGETAFIHRS